MIKFLRFLQELKLFCIILNGLICLEENTDFSSNLQTFKMALNNDNWKTIIDGTIRAGRCETKLRLCDFFLVS